MKRVCYYHAGCPDGFGAAWAVWKSWRGDGVFVPRGHDDPLDSRSHETDQVVFVDIAPPSEPLRDLLEVCAQVVILDHHVSSLERFQRDPELGRRAEAGGHRIEFDLSHSGAMLAWRHFGGGAEPPDLLRYVEDQDLWSWALPKSREVNAAIGSYPRRFDVWSELAARPVEELAQEGAPIVRAQQVEVERTASGAHPILLMGRRIEAVNATHCRSLVGHELAQRAAFGVAWGCVYRVSGDRVDATLYSIGDVDVAEVAQRLGGGGHRNAAGFSVPLARWLGGAIDP